MKNQVTKFVLVGVATLFFGASYALCADNTPPAEATPGTPAAQDSKSQINDPSGPNHQKTADVSPNTKDVHNDPAGPSANGTDQSGATATKTPQQDTPPATTNP